MSGCATTRLRTLIRTALLICSAGVAAGCASAATEAAGADLSEAERAAVEAATQSLNSATAPVLKSIEARSWPDSSLGCPQPGMSYMQVITPGYIVLLEANGSVHEVHVAGGNAVPCQPQVSGVLRRAGSPTRATSISAMEEQAVADLARRLNAPAESIAVKQRLARRFTDANLDCLTPDGPGAQGTVAGFKLRLEHAGRSYTYHTDLKRVLPCPPIEAD